MVWPSPPSLVGDIEGVAVVRDLEGVAVVGDIEGVAVVRGEIGWSGGSYAENHLLSKGEIWQHEI